MKLHAANADIFVPDGVDVQTALSRTTHLAICAHPDDIEILAYHGIAECYGRNDRWFTGVVVTNGSGSPRTGAYAGFTDEEMQAVRLREQRKAAQIGEYSCQIQLRYPSPAVKDTTIEGVREDLATITDACRAEYAYIHNLADKHDTHVGVALRSIDALRSLDPENRPQKVYGCEVWRDLDWMVDEEKVALPTSDKPHLASALLGVFDSQISGGKRYDLAAIGRRLANATFYSSHKTDTETGLTFAMDLTPLVADPFANPIKYVVAAIERFQIDVEERLRQFS